METGTVLLGSGRIRSGANGSVSSAMNGPVSSAMNELLNGDGRIGRRGRVGRL